MGLLQNKIALVFGAGSVGKGWGNGNASAVSYAREGAKVAVVDVHNDAAQATRDIIESEGGEAVAISANVEEETQINDAIATTLEQFGRIDILHNNVGINVPGGAIDADLKSWQQVMNVNITSMFLTCRNVLPVMVKQKTGVIINISSIAAIRYTGYPYISYYASKAAVNHYTRAVAVEFADRGIRANTIMPGVMDTPHIYQHISGYYNSREEMKEARDAIAPMKRQGSGWDVAWASVFLASDKAKYITGIELPVDGGLHCVSGG